MIRAPLGVRVALPLILVLLALGLVRATLHIEDSQRERLTVAPALPFQPDSLRAQRPPRDDGSGQTVPSPRPLWLKVQPGETLSELFAGLGLEAGEANQAVQALDGRVDPRRVRAGQAYAAYLDGVGGLSRLDMRLGAEGRVRLARSAEGWRSEWIPFVRSSAIKVVEGELTASLEGAIVDAGASPLLAYKMADVLQWDLDFTRDLRLGDRFQVIYEEVYLDGRYSALGDILALTYENRGVLHEAYRFGEDEGYYDAEGRPLKKMFLRSPLRFSRVTSRFSHRRFHPVLKVYRPHYGVDYGAPTGTPVRVTANGSVSFAAWGKGAGRMVKVRHAKGYLTAYLHLSGFADGIRPGVRVRQGQVIGYVGSTGLSTGPHLDYRVQRNGRWMNPLALDSEPARPLESSEMPAFNAHRDLLRASLASGRSPTVEPPVDPAEMEAIGAGVATAR